MGWLGLERLDFPRGNRFPRLIPMVVGEHPMIHETSGINMEEWRMNFSNIEDLTLKSRGFHMLHKHTEMGIILDFFMVFPGPGTKCYRVLFREHVGLGGSDYQ